jgi:hypothetical protein
MDSSIQIPHQSWQAAGWCVPRILRRKKPQSTLGLFLFGSGFVDYRHQGLGVFATDDEPFPLVVLELNNDYLLPSAPKG